MYFVIRIHGRVVAKAVKCHIHRRNYFSHILSFEGYL